MDYKIEAGDEWSPVDMTMYVVSLGPTQLAHGLISRSMRLKQPVVFGFYCSTTTTLPMANTPNSGLPSSSMASNNRPPRGFGGIHQTSGEARSAEDPSRNGDLLGLCPTSHDTDVIDKLMRRVSADVTHHKA